MKKDPKLKEKDDLRPEYDFSKLKRAPPDKRPRLTLVRIEIDKDTSRDRERMRK